MADLLNNSPAISVVMAVYNGAESVRAAIDSILEQTEIDFELIIVDDGSTDNTCSIIENYQDSRIKLVHNLINSGLATSLNNGIKVSSGKYIARMDADDICYPNRLKLQKIFLDENQRIAVVGGNADYINQDGSIVRKTNMLHKPEDIKKFIMRRNPLIHPTVMFRREFIKAMEGYDQKHRRKEDYDLWLRGSQKYLYANISDSLIQYQARDSKVFSADLYAFYIRILNAFRLRQYLTGIYWAFTTLGINILRKFGYRQKIFRQNDSTEK